MPPIVGVAASAGGPPALATLLAGLGKVPAAVLIVQHLPADFIDDFVAWMARESALPVELASDQAPVREGTVVIAPAHAHLKLTAGYRIALDSNPASPYCPSADVLFESIAASAGRHAVGVVLTGIGDDGAAGLLLMRQRGALTIVQDGASAAVDGMPRAARDLGAATMVLPLPEIAQAVRAALLARAA
jgi:chemotaxis response regulator CheB